MLDFVEEGQAEALLAMEAGERNRRHSYPAIEKVLKNAPNSSLTPSCR